MTTCNEIHKILENPEKENLKIECKESDVLRNDDGQRKLGYEIVALANRYGGKLIIGAKNNGTLEGKGIFDLDRDKGIVENICHTKISPVIEYDVEFLQCDHGDLLVVNVPKRKGAPHAYIVSRKGPEIKNRIYYIRTSHGKRLVSDKQLEWLFIHQEDPDFTFRFRVIINYFKDSLGIPAHIERPSSTFHYIGFVNNIPENEIGRLTRDRETIESFFLEITPYALIHSFSWLFALSWLVDIQRYLGKISYKPIVKNVMSKKISVCDLPKPPKDSVIASLSWNFDTILKGFGFPDFYVPLNSNLQIGFDNKGKKSELSLKHNDFNFTFIFAMSSMGGGLDHVHPLGAVLMDPKRGEGQEKIRKLFNFIEITCMFKASFNFPEHNVELFNEYYQYAKTVKDHLENDWDYDNFIKKLPNYKLYAIDSKLSNILTILDKKL